MRRSIVHAVGHRVRMVGRAGLSRARCRRSIRGSDHTIVTHDAVLRNVRFRLRGSGHRIVIGPQARLSDLVITMEGTGHDLQIGRNVRIHAGAMSFYDDRGTVTIGDHTAIYEASFGVMEGGRISVGEACLFATAVDIRNGDSHSIIDVASGSRLNAAADVVIAEHVWLGARVMVLKGSRIAANSIVGAGSIVAGALPEGCVAAGVPARVVAQGVTWRGERV
jgi:acetyltransferase-like isoleucine patch superfamily enzyme